MKKYILTVGDSFDPDKGDLSEFEIVSVEELTTCHDCALYGRARPKYCEFIDKHIPSFSFCFFGKHAPADAAEFYVDNIKL